ncbi:adenosine deaminase family protein [Coraliomargarita parva]|uniref:adenosine deaminase family protein n=1 Tax=Coraliomargarita parva TaxID=3014050 RepID=UPI0022B57B15|nr:hypothetical protein [Coraliomargarita parva]
MKKSLLSMGLALAGLCASVLYGEPSKVFDQIKQAASPDELYALLYAVPKGGDLHHHGGGSMPMEYALDYYLDAERNGGRQFYIRTRIEACPEHRLRPEVMYHVLGEWDWKALDPCLQKQFKLVTELTEAEQAAWLSDLKIDQEGEGRDEFFEKIWWRMGPVFNDLSVGPDLLVENMKAMGKEGLRYIEMQVIPWSHTDAEGNPVSAELWYETYKKRLAQPDALATGVTMRFQVVIIRFLPEAEDHVRRAFEFIDKHRDLFVGINMAGREDEGKGQAARFTEVYREMQRLYPKIPLAIHAGEADEGNSNIRDTLALGADRIGHGLNLLKDTDTYLLMRQNQYMVEVNLVSNKLLEYVPDPMQHPFPVLLRTGIPVSLNTDDRGMWDSTFTDEYYSAVRYYNLSWEELVKVGRDSLVYSFLEPSKKAELMADYDAAVLEFESTYLTEDWRDAVQDVDVTVSNYGKENFGLTSAVNLGDPIE